MNQGQLKLVPISIGRVGLESLRILVLRLQLATIGSLVVFQTTRHRALIFEFAGVGPRTVIANENSALDGARNYALPFNYR